MESRFNIYMYPMWDYEFLKAKHPYVYNLSSGLSSKFKILNFGKESKNGILNIIRYFAKTDIIYLNWIENIKYSQVFKFLLIFVCFKISRKKVIWTHHNLSPHTGDSRSSRFIRSVLTKYSDLIIIHTKESLNFLGLTVGNKKVFNFFHPLFSNHVTVTEPTTKKFDLLIWGNVRESKGVYQFLDYLNKANKLASYRIKIVGKFSNQDLYERVACYSSNTISIENNFIDYPDLDALHAESKFVFFPYTGKSVLNSGALITSLPKGVPIIGPYKGAFKEMGELGLINIYRNFEDVLNYVDNYSATTYPYNLIKEFCTDHTWENFATSLDKRLNEC